MTIVEFLTARLNEDEAIARAAVGTYEIDPPSDNSFHVYDGAGRAWLLRFTPARLLADIAAKWDVLEEAVMMSYDEDDAIAQHGEDILTMLAAAFADHLDYNESWPPTQPERQP